MKYTRQRYIDTSSHFLKIVKTENDRISKTSQRQYPLILISTPAMKPSNENVGVNEIDYDNLPAVVAAREKERKLEEALQRLRDGSIPDREYKLSLRKSFIQRRYGKRWNPCLRSIWIRDS